MRARNASCCFLTLLASALYINGVIRACSASTSKLVAGKASDLRPLTSNETVETFRDLEHCNSPHDVSSESIINIL